MFGLSYGGFLANWLVGTSDRFAAAVSENGVANNVSAWAGSDCGPTYSASAGIGDATTPEGVELLWRQSPLRHVAAISHAAADAAGRGRPALPARRRRAAVRGAAGARPRGRRTCSIPESAHEYVGTGTPDRRIDRQTRVIEWFGRWMPA